MLVTDFIITLLIALVVATIFVLLLGWRRAGEEAVWPALLFFFALVWLGSWTIGRWVTPFGPTYWGAPVLTFVFFALMVAFVLMATVPVRPRTAVGPGRPESAAPEVVAFGVFFWVALLILIVGLFMTY